MSKETWLDDKGNEITEEYIIINKTAIQKRIEKLEKVAAWESEEYGELKALKRILSQSTPLIPEIEKAYESGVDSLQDNLIQKLGLRYQTNEVSSTTINSTRGNLEDYISNLKLNI